MKRNESATPDDAVPSEPYDEFDDYYADYYYADDYYADADEDLTCEHCSGTGGDPWDEGILPCEHCDGEGYKWWM